MTPYYALADWTCATCTTEGRRGSCCPGRCYCGHETCHAFASWKPRPVLNVTDISKPKGKKGSAWAEREESTWIDQL